MTAADAAALDRYSERKRRTLALADQIALRRERWLERHSYYYEEDWRYMRFLIPEGKRVLDLGCGNGAMLDALRPSHGVGVDFSGEMIRQARANHPHLTFIHADAENLASVAELSGTFDVIVVADTIGSFDDCVETFRSLHRYCTPDTRIIVSYHTRMWEPLISLYGRLEWKQPVLPRNWLSSRDIANLLDLVEFDVIKREWRLLVPFWLLGIGRLINRFIAPLPLLRKIGLRNFVIARPRPKEEVRDLSTTVVIPCRNERGNIEAAITRMPRFCSDLEIIFIEGGSRDGTWEEVQRVKTAYPQYDIKAFQQTGTGKGNAVREGFAKARGDVLMILDADLTVAPEDLPKFYQVLAAGKGEFVNGSRLVYPMEKEAMRFLNLLANYLFAQMFTYLLNQRYTDTLCGTKVISRANYHEIEKNRAYFGDFDPFGDFDLIFGASKLNLKTAELPVRYAARRYGETQISRFRHGLLLARMVMFAFMKLKAL